MQKSIINALLLCVTVVGIVSCSESLAESLTPITKNIIGSISYPLDAKNKITFKGDGEPECSGKIGEFDFKCAETPAYGVYGDLNGDAIGDAAVILDLLSWGSNAAQTLYAVLASKKETLVVGPVYIGDRVLIEKMEIHSGTIVMNLIVHGPDDASCCPTMKKTIYYNVKDGELVNAKKNGELVNVNGQ